MTGFEQPESAHYHEGSDTWFVCNIAGETGMNDGRGWIMLYVVDVDRAHLIDILSAQIRESQAFEGAALLNDVAVGPAQPRKFSCGTTRTASRTASHGTKAL